MSLATIICIFLILAAFALVWWGVNRLSIPEPIKTVVLVTMGLIMLVIIWTWVTGGGIW